MRCIALNPYGIQCRRKAIGVYSYHGDGEIYGCDIFDADDRPQSVCWVAAPLCSLHKKQDETHKQSMARMRKQRQQ